MALARGPLICAYFLTLSRMSEPCRLSSASGSLSHLRASARLQSSSTSVAVPTPPIMLCRPCCRQLTTYISNALLLMTIVTLMVVGSDRLKQLMVLHWVQICQTEAVMTSVLLCMFAYCPCLCAWKVRLHTHASA